MTTEKVLPWIDHLEELRRRLAAVLICLASGFGLGLVFHRRLIGILTLPLHHSQEALYFTSPAEGFLVMLKAALAFGLVLAAPFALWHLWQFVKPGLKPQERKAVLPLFTMSLALFLAGAALCYFWVLPLALDFLLGVSSQYFRPLLSVGHYASFVLFLILAFGLSFNLPLVIIALAQLNIVTAAWLAHIRKFAILGVFVLAAIATPSPDVLSQILLAVPLLVLFEVTVRIVAFLERGKRVY